MIEYRKTSSQYYCLFDQIGQILSNSYSYVKVEELEYDDLSLLICYFDIFKYIDVFNKATGEKMFCCELNKNKDLYHILQPQIDFYYYKKSIKKANRLKDHFVNSFRIPSSFKKNSKKNENIEISYDFDSLIKKTIRESVKKKEENKEKPFGVEFGVLEVRFGHLDSFNDVARDMKKKWNESLKGTIAFNIAKDFCLLLKAYEKESKEQIEEMINWIEEMEL